MAMIQYLLGFGLHCRDPEREGSANPCNPEFGGRSDGPYSNVNSKVMGVKLALYYEFSKVMQ